MNFCKYNKKLPISKYYDEKCVTVAIFVVIKEI